MFEIHAPPPHLVPTTEVRFEALPTALFAVLSPSGESMFWVWNGVPVRVGYQSQFSTVFHDVLGIVEALLAKPSSRGHFGLREYSLITEWRLEWSQGALSIDSTWYETPGRLEPLLNERARIEMRIDAFLAEWKMPFRRLLDAFDASGVAVTEDAPLLERLRRAEAAIPRFGAIYGDEVLGSPMQ